MPSEASEVQALDIVRRSGGAAVTVDDDTLMRWQQQVARTEGLLYSAVDRGGTGRRGAARG
jgi:hypothetical protein